MNKNKLMLSIVILAMTIAIGNVQEARAKLITYQFTGNVNNVDVGLASTFDTTQTLSGFFTYDSSISDAFPSDPVNATYFGALTDLHFTLGGQTGTGYTPELIGVTNNDAYGRDIYSFLSRPTASSPGISGLLDGVFLMRLFDNTGMAFSSDAMPLALSLSDFDQPVWAWYFRDTEANTSYNVAGEITSLTAVPEPSSLILMGIGLAGIGFVRLRKRS